MKPNKTWLDGQDTLRYWRELDVRKRLRAEGKGELLLTRTRLRKVWETEVGWVG